MLDTTDTLEAEHAAALAALPVPMSPTCVRSLLNTCAREHVYAEAHRKSGQQHGRRRKPRAGRLIRLALRARARAGDLLAEVR